MRMVVALDEHMGCAFLNTVCKEAIQASLTCGVVATASVPMRSSTVSSHPSNSSTETTTCSWESTRRGWRRRWQSHIGARAVRDAAGIRDAAYRCSALSTGRASLSLHPGGRSRLCGLSYAPSDFPQTTQCTQQGQQRQQRHDASTSSTVSSNAPPTKPGPKHPAPSQSVCSSRAQPTKQAGKQHVLICEFLARPALRMRRAPRRAFTASRSLTRTIRQAGRSTSAASEKDEPQRGSGENPFCVGYNLEGGQSRREEHLGPLSR